jgi:hypothetical protein
MKILFGYLKGYWKLVLLALLLAAVNQIFFAVGSVYI